MSPPTPVYQKLVDNNWSYDFSQQKFYEHLFFDHAIHDPYDGGIWLRRGSLQ